MDTTVQRVNAYRYYREQKGDYWTAERLERDHWEFLYGLVSLQKNLARMSDQRTVGMVYNNVVEARVVLAEHMGRAEELIPLQNLGVFFPRHQSHARLVGLYPEARVYKDAVPVGVVNAFRETFRGQVLPACGFGVLRRGGIESRNRILKVAGDSDLIVFPKASAEACLLAAYAMSKCAEIYEQLTWYGSALTLVQRDVALKHPCVDFFFWVMYGSWSFCDDCGSYWFNDQYFRERVYQDQATADTPDLCAAYRRLIPSDPMEHEYGKLGISSRWWYLPGASGGDPAPRKRKSSTASSDKKGGAIVKSKSSAIVKTATKKAKEQQSSTAPSKSGLISKIKGAIKAGADRHSSAVSGVISSQHRKSVKRHRKATQVPRVFGKGVVSGVKKVGKFVGDAKQAIAPSKKVQKATTKSQKEADQDGDGKVRTIDAGYEPQGDLVNGQFIGEVSVDQVDPILQKEIGRASCRERV